MKKCILISVLLISIISTSHAQVSFNDNFNNGISSTWQWLDADNSAWNTNGGRLNMKRYPGHGFYQTPNDRVPVLNYLVGQRVNGVEAIVTVGFDIDRQYGQAGMIWYYDKENWTKFVIEYWWDRGIYVINLREQNGIACHNASCEMDYQYSGKTSVDLKMRYENGKYITSLRPAGSSGAWTNHFTFDANPDGGNNLRIGLFSQADSGSNDWAWFDNFNLNVPGVGLRAPSISSQPVSATVAQGGSATFSVQASGNPVPSYQWYKNNSAVSGANSNSYTVTNAQPANAGNYYVVVSNSQGSIASNTVNLTVNAPISQGPYAGAISLPGTIQAENYDVGGSGVAYVDNTSGNTGGQYRNDDVDIEVCAEGGYNVGWIDNGEWLEYTVSPTSGNYNINLRYASATAPGNVKVLLDGTSLGTFNFSSTGGWQNWQNATLGNVNITGGTNKVLRLELSGGLNINNIQFNQVSVDNIPPSAPANASATPISTTSIAVTWTASTDNIGVTAYEIYNGNSLIGTSTSTSFNVNNLQPNTSYSFSVKAKDAAGNISTPSNTASATTKAVSADLNFFTSFNGSITPPLVWLDEDASAWNLNNNRVNMKRYNGCGFFCNARVPVLYYPKVPFNNGMSAQVKVGFDVDRKYGQAGLIVYFNNDTYAKLVIEYFFDQGINIILLQEIDGVKQNNLVLSGSDNVAYGATSVEIKIDYADGKFTTFFRPIGSTNWSSHCVTTSIPNRGPVNIGLFSQADSGSNDWAWFDDFSIYSPNAVTTPPVTNRVPYLGNPVALPGKIEAENYDTGASGITYNDATAGNTGSQYRTDNVDIEVCAEGGYNVGWTDANEWLEYTVAHSAGNYTVNLRYASGMDNSATVKLLLNGVTLGTSTVPNTGGWQIYKTISFTNIQLSDASSAILRLEFTNWGSNMNHIEFIKNSTVTGNITGAVTREIWSNINGTTINTIPFTTAPSSTSLLSSLEIPINSADNYGTRIKGYIVPSTSGVYNFYISGDDYCEFWLSNNSDPAGKTKTAEVAGWTNSKEWTKYPAQKSSNVSLTAGTRYYFEILHKEGGGGDNVAVGWTGPGIPSIAVIGSANISQYNPGGAKKENSLEPGTGSVLIFPSPFSNTLNISNIRPIEKVNLISVYGESIFTLRTYNEFVTLSTEALAPGTYFIEIITNDGNMIRKKIIKQ